ERFDVYIADNEAKFLSFLKFSDKEAAYQLKKYTRVYPGLDRVMFILSEWAEKNGLFSHRLQSHHVYLILILYATGRINGYSMNCMKPFLDCLELSIKPAEEVPQPERLDQYNQTELFVAFFEYMASREFRKLAHISFATLEYPSMFSRGEWMPLHEVGIFIRITCFVTFEKAAIKTYYNMVFNLRLEEIHDTPQQSLTTSPIRECEPFVIELPGESSVLIS
ncbi:hypothetical protein COOONC_26235, partial [Cooperia oncophora]